MPTPQPGILPAPPAHARYLSLQLTGAADPHALLESLEGLSIDESCVVGIGQRLVTALGRDIQGLRTFQALEGPGVGAPSTPAALWLWLRGDDPGALLHAGRDALAALGPGVEVEESIDAFLFDGGRDLTGYEDGTENPTGDEADAVAFVSDAGAGLDGGSYVAVQRWRHQLDRFAAMSQSQQDNAIGRRRSDNEELDDAPATAHVKRSAQEDFDPEAFMLRRSMPWILPGAEGLMFVAFGRSFDAFEAVLRRMLGLDDGLVDALFAFSRPLTGSYFWCPPVVEGRLDLSALRG